MNNLEAETMRVMITTGRALLKNKMEELHSSNTPKIVKEVSNKLFTSRPTQQAPTAPPPWRPILPLTTTQLQHQHPFEVRLTPPRMTACPILCHGSPRWSFSSGCTTCLTTKKTVCGFSSNRCGATLVHLINKGCTNDRLGALHPKYHQQLWPASLLGHARRARTPRRTGAIDDYTNDFTLYMLHIGTISEHQ